MVHAKGTSFRNKTLSGKEGPSHQTPASIARLPTHESSRGFYPGHQKWDFGYSVGELKPDVVAHLCSHNEAPEGLRAKDAAPFLTNYAYLRSVPLRSPEWLKFRLHVRCDSSNIKWEDLPRLGLIPDSACQAFPLNESSQRRPIQKPFVCRLPQTGFR